MKTIKSFLKAVWKFISYLFWLYTVMQLVISLGFIYFCPDTVFAHWLYLVGVSAVLVIAYILFMKKYYRLHEEYLISLKQ